MANVSVNLPVDVVITPSMTADNEGNAHICYFDSAKESIRYLTNRPGDWVTYTVKSGVEFGGACDIAVESTGKVHIVFEERTHFIGGSSVGLYHARSLW